MSFKMFRNINKLNYLVKCNPHSLYLSSLRVYSQLHQSVSNTTYLKFSSLLTNYGFNPGQIKRILHSPESILSFDKNELFSNLAYWLTFEVNKDKLNTTLCAYPELLTLNPVYAQSRVQELMSLFTKKDINKLLITCPRVFTDDFSVIYDKVEYIVHFMGVEQKSIVKSRALQFDLHHIKCRHIFLTRAGRYIKPKRDLRTKNPPLDKIFSRNLQTFLKLTKLTEEEYEVFCHSYGTELLNELDSDPESLLYEDSDNDL